MEPQSKAFVVWGAGGHGRVVGELIRSLGHELAGYVDRDPAKLGRPILAGDAKVRWLETKWLAEMRDGGGGGGSGNHAVALGIGDNRARQDCLRAWREMETPPLVHPSAVVSSTAQIGPGSVILPLAVVHTDAVLGDGVIVNTGAIVEHDCEVASAAHISPGATLCGGVRIGERSWIGAGATVVPGIEIGADVTVGAGSLVLQNVSGGKMVMGVPARPK